jgi:putative ABC transport system permease protein
MGGSEFSIAGRPTEGTQRLRVDFNRVSPKYFATLGIRITHGRPFNEQDRSGSLPVAIVNEAFAKRYLAGSDALAHRILLDERADNGPILTIERQIIGVYADVRVGGPRNESQPAIEVPFWQSPRPQVGMAIRTAFDPTAVQLAVADVIGSLDSDLPMGNVKTMEQVVNERMAADRFNMALFASFAGVALLLAAVGIYGVMTFVVAQRTREIGLRMALGARRWDVLGQVLREGMTTAGVGAVLGSAGAYFVAQAMRGLLPGVTALRPIDFAVITLTLLASAFLACLVPARRAVSVDPMVALRQE